MPNLALGDNVLVTKNGLVSGQRIMSTFGYVVSAITGTPDQNTIFTELNLLMSAAGELYDSYNACCPDEYEKGDVWFQVIRPTRWRKFVKADLSVGGLSGYSGTQPNIAGVITRTGALGRRDNISTLHVPSPSEAGWVQNGLFQEAAQVNYAQLAEMVRATYTTVTNPAVFSPSILNGPLATNVTPINYAFYQPTARVMRRRTVGLGI